MLEGDVSSDSENDGASPPTGDRRIIDDRSIAHHIALEYKSPETFDDCPLGKVFSRCLT